MMCNEKKYPLSLSGDTFNGFKQDFDNMLRSLLTEMDRLNSDEAVINVKMVVSLEDDKERDFEANGYDATKDITKPTFKHEISTVMQIKNKKTGQLGGNMKLVWDREAGQYVMQEIDNGQQSLFDKKTQEQTDNTEPAALPPSDGGGVVYDVPYEEVGDGMDYEEPAEEA